MSSSTQATQAFDSIGIVAKVHGLRGEIGIRTDLPFPDQAEKLTRLYIAGDQGMMQPYRVTSSRMSNLGNKQLFFVILETVADRNTASTLMGRDVYADKGSLDFFEEDDDDVVGYTVLALDGSKLGEVVEVIDNPAHPILLVRLKGKGSVLIPFVDAYIEEIDDEKSTITVSDIDELLEL